MVEAAARRWNRGAGGRRTKQEEGEGRSRRKEEDEGVPSKTRNASKAKHEEIVRESQKHPERIPRDPKKNLRDF